jgi:uncharacterized protein YtpQ (UPF0354 family)
VIGVLLMILSLSAQAFAQTLSPRAFTEESVKAIKAVVPSAVVTTIKDLEFTTGFPDGRTAKHVYQAYSKDPEGLQSLMQAHLIGLSRLPNPQLFGQLVAASDRLSPRAFTEEFVKAFRTAAPSATIELAGDLEIIVRRSGGAIRTVNLANFYTIYSNDPERLKDLIHTKVAMLVSPSRTTFDPARVIPVVKDREWLRQYQEKVKAAGGKQEQLVEDLNSELVISYAEDTPHAMYHLTTDDYSGHRRKLRTFAIKNLLRVLPKIEMHVVNEYLSIVSAGEDYTPSLLLLDDLWTGGQIKVKGEIVVAVPARDVILVTGSRSGKMTNFRAFAAELCQRSPFVERQAVCSSQQRFHDLWPQLIAQSSWTILACRSAAAAAEQPPML